jgi:hypothetical protein
MSNLGPVKHFSSVRKARQALQGQAQELLEEYKAAIKMAVASGKYEEALKAYQWLLDHVPGEDGERMFEPSVDKVTVVEGPRGPTVQIVGIQLGGVGSPKAELPAATKDEDTIEGEVI